MASDDLVRRRARQLAAEAAASGDPAGWFETLYAEARVAEVYTVQALYGQARAAAIQALPGLVARGGTLLVIAGGPGWVTAYEAARLTRSARGSR
jgi:hypothetical protein